MGILIWAVTSMKVQVHCADKWNDSLNLTGSTLSIVQKRSVLGALITTYTDPSNRSGHSKAYFLLVLHLKKLNEKKNQTTCSFIQPSKLSFIVKYISHIFCKRFYNSCFIVVLKNCVFSDIYHYVRSKHIFLQNQLDTYYRCYLLLYHSLFTTTGWDICIKIVWS